MKREKAVGESREAINLRLFGRRLTPCSACGWGHYERVHCFRLKRGDLEDVRGEDSVTLAYQCADF